MDAGYRLLAIICDDHPVALAGFRFAEDLIHGRYIYIDDLVVAEVERRQGHAERLLDAVADIARRSDVPTVALDTGIDNVTAQEVYERCGYLKLGYHLIRRL